MDAVRSPFRNLTDKGGIPSICSSGESGSCRIIGNPWFFGSFCLHLKKKTTTANRITPTNAPMQPTMTFICWVAMLWLVDCVVRVLESTVFGMLVVWTAGNSEIKNGVYFMLTINYFCCNNLYELNMINILKISFSHAPISKHFGILILCKDQPPLLLLAGLKV